MRNKKLLNGLLIVSSLFGYLEWGGGRWMLLFQAEADMFARAVENPGEVLHPLTVLPVLGQLALLATLFQRAPSKGLTYFGIVGIGLLLLLMFVIGIMDTNIRILASTIPFLVLAALAIRAHRVRA